MGYKACCGWCHIVGVKGVSGTGGGVENIRGGEGVLSKRNKKTVGRGRQRRGGG